MAPHGLLLKLVLGVCFAGIATPVALAQVVLDPESPPPAIDDQWHVLEDAPASALDAVEAPARQSPLFVDRQAAPPVVWARLDLESTGAEDVRWILPMTVDLATVFVVGPTGVLDTVRTGFTVPLANRPVSEIASPVIALDLPAGAKRTLVAEIRHDPTGYTATRPMEPRTIASYLADRRRSGILDGMLIGLLSGLALYNLFLFASFRDKSYLYYVTYLLGSILYWTTNAGFDVEFLWPPDAQSHYELNFLGLVIAASSYLLFSRTFLRTSELAPLLDRVLLGLTAIWVLTAVGGLASMAGAPLWAPVQVVAAVSALALHCATIAASVQAHRRGYGPARYYLVASLSLVVTGFLYTLGWLGWINAEWGTTGALQLGMGIEALLLATALSYRIRSLERQRSQAIANHEVAQATNAALRETDALRTDLLGFAAHDLRSPLTGVVGYAELISYEAPPDSDISEFAGVIQKEADRMLGLIDDLLVTSALDGRAIELVREPTDLGAMLTEVVASYRPRAEAKAQTLVLEVDPGALADLDQARFRDVLDNLISNAVKYTPNGGSIHVSLAVRDDLEVRVSDTGPGLTAEDRTKLFGRFQRLSAQPTGGESSTGLGLSIARDLILLHGGSIEVESEPGHGATFIVSIPALAQAVEA